jgi:7-carboxy-7-deazaguanine synthase
MQLAAMAPGVPEIFLSLQGEGASQGRPSLFIRLARCNLACVWCDTPYTWNFEGTPFAHRDGRKFSIQEEVIEITPEAVAARALTVLGPARRVVLTGGEPLLQQDALVVLATALKAGGVDWIEIETNAAIAPKPAMAALIDQFNASPKLANSGNAAAVAHKAQALAWFGADPRTVFKFVVAAPGDVEEAAAIAQAAGAPASRVWLMPEGVNPQALAEKAGWLAAACLAYGFNYTDRLHIRLYGDTRGT